MKDGDNLRDSGKLLQRIAPLYIRKGALKIVGIRFRDSQLAIRIPKRILTPSRGKHLRQILRCLTVKCLIHENSFLF